MFYQVLADMVVIIHLLFILFVVFGGLILLRWSKLIWLHLVAVGWAVMIEISGQICPLTPLENWLREQGGLANPYQDSFVERYLIPIIYPETLTRDIQLQLAFAVITVNLIIYGLIFRIRKNRIGAG